ncbi:MAG: hypothetical protein WBG37_19495 [Desulfobacterales bacterium]|jgi:hypothetical protein
MDIVTQFLHGVDPVLIAPFRWLENPALGWWTGTFFLALWATVLGELTLAVAYRVNRAQVAKNFDKTAYYHEQSMKAKAAGDEQSYKGINKLANEAYGKSFFLFMAMSMASLWPAFFAAAWLQLRFADLQFVLPAWAGGVELSFLAPFIVVYIAIRFVFSKVKRFIPFLNPNSETPERQPG